MSDETQTVETEIDETGDESLDDIMEGLDEVSGRGKRPELLEDDPEETPEEETPAESGAEEVEQPEETAAEVGDTEAEVPTPEEAAPEEGEAEEPEAGVEEQPVEAGAEESEELDPDQEVILTTDNDAFTIADLRDPDRLAQYRQVVRDGVLMQSDYTRKSQRRAELERAHQVTLRQQSEVVGAVLKNPQAIEFLQHHGRVAWDSFMRDPQNALTVLRDPEALSALWKQADTLAENPDLQERLADSARAEAAQTELSQYQAKEVLTNFAVELGKTVATLAKEYPSVDEDDVSRLLLISAGVPQDRVDAMSVGESWAALQHLYGTLVERHPVPDETGQMVPQTFLNEGKVRAQFETLSRYASRDQEETVEEVEAHNRATDEALSQETAPSVGEGEAAGPPSRKPEPEPDDVREIMDDLDAMAFPAKSG